MSGAMAGAGGEWEKHVDEASSSTYYYNARTGESSWEVPAGFESPQAQESRLDDAPKWREFVDDESGGVYYYNEASGTSRWEKPEDFESENETQQVDKAKDETEAQEQQVEEAVETTSEQDAKGKKQGEEATGKEETARLDDHKTLTNELEGGDKAADKSVAAPKRWVKYIDTSSNKPYYYNASTGKTQWEEPDEYSESAAATAAGPQVSVEYQAHLNRMRTERLARVTQQVLDPSGNLSKLNAILSKVDSNTPSILARVEGKDAEDAPRATKAEWQQHIDAQTQRYYYHNVITGVTQWNKPDAPIVSGLADWIPPETPEADVNRTGHKTVSGVNYAAQAKFNRLTGKYEQLGGDEYWQHAGIASDRAGRQMSHFFDMTELEKNREEARRRKEQLKRKNIDWKKITAEKKAKKQKQRNEWLYTD